MKSLSIKRARQANPTHLRYFLLVLTIVTLLSVVLVTTKNSLQYAVPITYSSKEFMDVDKSENSATSMCTTSNMLAGSICSTKDNPTEVTSTRKVLTARKLNFSGSGELQRRPKRVSLKLLPAKWPLPRDWPEPWIRRANSSDGNSLFCDMKNITEMLRPPLPTHFEKSTFYHLPRRYRDLVSPHPLPPCGLPKLLHPWTLVQQGIPEHGEKKNFWMLFVVKSSPGNEERRTMMRKILSSQNITKNHWVFVLFVIGKTNYDNITKNLIMENKKYGDLLQCDFVDSYRKLPIKVLATFRWLLERDFDIQFFTMTDDDCVVNLARVVEFYDANVTVHEDYFKYLYCGYWLHKGALPMRKSGKWAVTMEEYPGFRYPTFCHGALWTLSRQLMHGIYCLSEITRVEDLFLEDVLITGILREKLNFKDTNIKEAGRKLERGRSDMVFHAQSTENMKKEQPILLNSGSKT